MFIEKYEYEEVDEYAALKALRGKVRVEYRFEWWALDDWRPIIPGVISVLVDQGVKFRIRREAKRKTVEEAIDYRKSGNGYIWGTNQKEALRAFAAALKAEILAEIQEARGE